MVPAAAQAGGVIERGCLKSPRPGAGRALCACLQQVADATLSASQQRRGAAFFADPHKSQTVKASDRPADDRFWAKWEAFAAAAVTHCQ
ncbi:MAG TPA: hypothetical protein ENK80_05295 [Rhodobacterales bacterium]|nr:hypothetical protein [Rhodobacterales bacterium]